MKSWNSLRFAGLLVPIFYIGYSIPYCSIIFQKLFYIKRSKKDKDNLVRDKIFIDERIKMINNFNLNTVKNCNKAAKDIYNEFQKIPTDFEYKVDTASECPDDKNMSYRVDIWLSPKKNIKLAIIIPPDAVENISTYPSYYETFLLNKGGEKIFDKELGYVNIHQYYKKFWTFNSLYNEIYFIKDMIRMRNLYE